MFVLQWLLRSCPYALQSLIEIIRPLLKTTVLIYRDKQAWPWPCSALTWMTASAPSSMSSINSGFSLDYTSHFLVIWKFFLFSSCLSFPFDICSVRKEIYVNSTSLNRSTLLSVPTDQWYWLHNALFTWLLPSLCCHYQTLCTKPVTHTIHCEREKSTSAIMKRAIALPTMWWLFALHLLALRPLNPVFKDL